MLSDEQIIEKAYEAGLYQDGINTQLPLWVLTQQELERFVRTIEAEVRKQGTEIIQQMLDALENHDGNYKLSKSAGAVVDAAITAARKRLENT